MDMTESNSSCNVAEAIRFHQLCLFFEKLQKAKTNAIRIKEFQQFVTKWNQLQSRTATFYPAFRLMLPQLDKGRAAYGVKEHLLAKLIIEILKLSVTGRDAQKLLKYRHNKTSSNALGDFAEVAFHHVLSKRCINKGNLSILEINACLDEISLHSFNKRKDLMKMSLLHLMQKTSAMEQKWLMRILLKDMKLRLSPHIFFREFHPDAESLYNVTTNLKTVCEKLKDPKVQLSHSEITMFHPFRPMLAAKIGIEEIENVLNGNNFQMEIKYDGERSQIHKNVDQYKYFSRNGNEYSTVFGETCYQGTLSKYIHSSFDVQVVSCIIDGEMMAYNPNLEVFMQKGGKFDIKHVTEDSEYQPCFVAFDLLFLNGETIVQQKQAKRFQLLQSIITPVEGRIAIAEAKPGRTMNEIVRYLNEAIDRREEGIVIKDLHSFYSPNLRKNSGWYKVKPEYVNGGSFGGKISSVLSIFHLGVGVKDPTFPENLPETFKTFCRVGSGYTDRELLQIIEKLKSNLKVLNKKNIPNWLEVGKEKPDVIIHPRNSLVVQVRASEIIPSTSYSTKCTLRFPRLVAVREDKSYSDAMNFDQLIDLQKAADGKLARTHSVLSTDQTKIKKQKKLYCDQPTTILTHYQGIDASDVSKVSNSFQGKIFCVINGTKDVTKKGLEKGIIEYGGKVVQNPSHDVMAVVADNDQHVKVRNIMKSQKYNIVRTSWLFRCLKSGCLEAWKPSELIFATQSTKYQLNVLYDKFGDDYTQDVDVESIRDLIFSRLEGKDLATVLPPEVIKSKNLLLQIFNHSVFTRFPLVGFGEYPNYLFKGMNFYLSCKHDGCSWENAHFVELQSLVIFYGGCIVENLHEEALSHVVIGELLPNAKLRQQITEVNSKRQKKYYVMPERWLRDCINQKNLLAERSYLVFTHAKNAKRQ